MHPSAAAAEVAVARASPNRPADRVAAQRSAAPRRGLVTWRPQAGMGAGPGGAAGSSSSYYGDEGGGSYGVSRPHLDPGLHCTGCACAARFRSLAGRPPVRHATHRRRRPSVPTGQSGSSGRLSLCNLAAPLGPASHGADPQAQSQAGGRAGSGSLHWLREQGNNNGLPPPLLFSAFLCAPVVFLSCSLPRRCGAVQSPPAWTLDRSHRLTHSRFKRKERKGAVHD
jgi:hypothetical protein